MKSEDPLDRMNDRIEHAKRHHIFVTLTHPEAEALVEIARAARELTAHEDLGHYPGWFARWDELLPVLHAALARLDSDTKEDA